MVKRARKAGKISESAGQQHGYIARWQLLAIGLSSSAIARRRDLIASRHQGVYAVGHVQRTPIALAHAAVLACGPEAVLSHDSAAALWGVRRWPATPEVSLSQKRVRPGIATHRTTTLRAHDTTTHYGIPVTTVVRTIVDIAARLTDRQLARAVNQTRLNGHLTTTALHELLLRCPRAQPLLAPDQNPTRSLLEDEFIAFTQRHGLPTPRINVSVDGTEVDALFEAEGVIVELDSWTYHGNPVTFRSDHARDIARAADGLLPLRMTGEQLTAAGADELHRILTRRRRRRQRW